MAILSSPALRTLFSYSVTIVLISCYYQHRRSDALPDFHTVEVTSLFPASVCSRSTVVSKRHSTMEVFHRHGPCSSHGQEGSPASSLTKILSNDEARVGHIRDRLTTKKAHRDQSELGDTKVTLPSQSGVSFGIGNYIVSIGLGTPVRSLSMIFDTGSYLTWTQCQPCVASCYRQRDPIFNPSASATYSNISCNSAACSQLAGSALRGCSSGTCLYGIVYGDRSYGAGFLSKDRLTLSNDVYNDFLFGCGVNNRGLFGSAAGMIGLGPHPLSLVSQTAGNYGRVFSYCLPSRSSTTGHLTFGSSEVSRDVKYTPFDTSQGTSFYFITITGISVGGRPLPISQTVFSTAGTIIDSGTVITRLPPSAYSQLSAAFKTLMSQLYATAPPFGILDTCFNTGNNTIIRVPKISFTFQGNLVVDLPVSGIVYFTGPSEICLAFAGNTDASSVGIWGNTQQRGFEIVHDLATGRLGIGAGGC